jgi:hypothetical protein
MIWVRIQLGKDLLKRQKVNVKTAYQLNLLNSLDDDNVSGNPNTGEV